MLTWVEISTNALAHNIRVFKKLIDGKKLMAVVKSNAYGHGMNLIANACARNKFVDAFGVAGIKEALELFRQGIKKPIVVLSFLDVERVAKMSQIELNHIRLPLYDMTTCRALLAVLKQRNFKARVHVKIDTGTTRIGFFPSQVSALSQFLQSAKKYILLEAIYTHFASSEKDAKFTAYQNNQLLKIESALHKAGLKNFYKHSACTAASVYSANLHMDMIRLGIGLYGLNPNAKIAKLLQKKTGHALKPILSWQSKLIQIKKISKGETVGYGRTFRAQKPVTIGIVPIGYYDGYDRKLSNKGYMIVRGTACPIAGQVCMNLTMIDISAISKTVKVGDIVTLLGGNSKRISSDELARSIGTINYEIVTRINPHIPRIKHT